MYAADMFTIQSWFYNLSFTNERIAFELNYIEHWLSILRILIRNHIDRSMHKLMLSNRQKFTLVRFSQVHNIPQHYGFAFMNWDKIWLEFQLISSQDKTSNVERSVHIMSMSRAPKTRKRKGGNYPQTGSSYRYLRQSGLC